MVDAFATAQNLADRLNRVFTDPEQTWVTVLLEDASAYLRTEVIGQNVYPQETVAFDDWPTGGRVDLPQFPVIEIGSVKRDGAVIDHEYRPGYITVRGDEKVEITYTYGYAEPPEDLVRLTCVLVSSVLLPLEQKLGLTAGGLSSVQLDDFKLAWADAGAQSGMVLPPIQAASVRAAFGRGGFTLVETGR